MTHTIKQQHSGDIFLKSFKEFLTIGIVSQPMDYIPIDLSSLPSLLRVLHQLSGPMETKELRADGWVSVELGDALPKGNVLAVSVGGYKMIGHLIVVRDRICCDDNGRIMRGIVAYQRLPATPNRSPEDTTPKERKCEAGCKVFYGGEVRHHKHCVFYPESLSQMYDDLKAITPTVKQTETVPMDFVLWYSGMSQEKIQAAFARWENEVSPASPSNERYEKVKDCEFCGSGGCKGGHK